MAGLPTNLSTGTVRGRFITAELLTTGDVGPDGVPVAGSVTFTPSAPAILDTAASPSPVTILPKPVTVSLSANGEIVNPVDASLGIQLLATDDADGNPTGWTYKATFALAGGLTLAPFSFSLPSGATVDLTTVTPVPDAGGTFYLTGPGPVPVLTGPATGGFFWSSMAPPSGIASSGVPHTTADRLGGGPILLGRAVAPAELAAQVATAAAGVTARVGLWATTGNGMPTGLPVWDSGSFSCAAFGVIPFAPPAGLLVPPGTYWVMGTMSDPTTARLRVFRPDAGAYSIAAAAAALFAVTPSFGIDGLVAPPANALPDVSGRTDYSLLASPAGQPHIMFR